MRAVAMCTLKAGQTKGLGSWCREWGQEFPSAPVPVPSPLAAWGLLSPRFVAQPPFPPSAPIWVLSTWVQTSPHSPFPNPVQSGASGLWQGTS